ncbi:unnamed protein product [Urochloa humidicola]
MLSIFPIDSSDPSWRGLIRLSNPSKGWPASQQGRLRAMAGALTKCVVFFFQHLKLITHFWAACCCSPGQGGAS